MLKGSERVLFAGWKTLQLLTYLTIRFPFVAFGLRINTVAGSHNLSDLVYMSFSHWKDFCTLSVIICILIFTADLCFQQKKKDKNV